MKIARWILLSSVVWMYTSAQQVEPIPGQTGIYFYSVGYIAFLPTKWKVVSYLNLEPTRTLWKNTKLYAKKVANSCQILEKYNWFCYTDCAPFVSCQGSRIKYIENLKTIVADFVQTEAPQDSKKNKCRSKRGALNFAEDIS